MTKTLMTVLLSLTITIGLSGEAIKLDGAYMKAINVAWAKFSQPSWEVENFTIRIEKGTDHYLVTIYLTPGENGTSRGNTKGIPETIYRLRADNYEITKISYGK